MQHRRRSPAETGQRHGYLGSEFDLVYDLGPVTFFAKLVRAATKTEKPRSTGERSPTLSLEGPKEGRCSTSLH